MMCFKIQKADVFISAFFFCFWERVEYFYGGERERIIEKINRKRNNLDTIKGLKLCKGFV